MKSAATRTGQQPSKVRSRGAGGGGDGPNRQSQWLLRLPAGPAVPSRASGRHSGCTSHAGLSMPGLTTPLPRPLISRPPDGSQSGAGQPLQPTVLCVRPVATAARPTHKAHWVGKVRTGRCPSIARRGIDDDFTPPSWQQLRDSITRLAKQPRRTRTQPLPSAVMADTEQPDVPAEPQSRHIIYCGGAFLDTLSPHPLAARKSFAQLTSFLVPRSSLHAASRGVNHPPGSLASARSLCATRPQEADQYPSSGLQYCEYGGTVRKCQEWLESHHKEMYDRIWSAGSSRPPFLHPETPTAYQRACLSDQRPKYHRGPRSRHRFPLRRGTKARRQGRPEEDGQGRGRRGETGRQARKERRHHQAHRAQQEEVCHGRHRPRGLWTGAEEGEWGSRVPPGRQAQTMFRH